MAYQTGSATDLGDLLTKLDVFMVANGWTQDDFDDGATTASQGFAQWNKGNVHVGLKWVANAPNNMSIHQALGNAGAVFPGAHTDDSGNGYNAAFGSDAQLDDERCVNDIGDGPFVSYHFFEQDASPAYVHVVVEIESEVFRHFGWGTLEKFNDWTGGEYCYGQFQDESTNSSGVDTATWAPFDAIQAGTSATSRRSTTIHAEGLPNQGVSEKWLQHSGGISSQASQANWTDSAGQNKQLSLGGFRGGPVGYLLGEFRSDVSTGHIPLYPWPIFTHDVSTSLWLLGNVPDIRGVDMRNFSPGQEVTVGSDVWIVFPSARRTEDNVVNRTYYQGIAYRKVTA